LANCEWKNGKTIAPTLFLKAYIEAGASGVHFEDQLGSEKKCGHMGGKVK
jgi:isocitrate lyase